MIQIQKIYIQKFRGIRELSIELNAKNFGICGPNGTGKSGIVDAIEFALTGDISRLSGKGTGDLSVRLHAPHVKEHLTPGEAKVTLDLFIPSLSKSATISRTVDKPSVRQVSPKSAEIEKILQEIEAHPEFTLSRREIIKYILSAPNERAKDVQELLQLSELEDARKAFTTTTNTIRSDRNAKQQSYRTYQREFFQAINIEKPTNEQILQVSNHHRRNLSLPPIDELTAGTDLKRGIDSQATVRKDMPNKNFFRSEIERISILAKEGIGGDTLTRRDTAVGILRQLVEDVSFLRLVRQHTLLKIGAELVEDPACPLCDLEWDQDLLKQHLAKKLANAQEASIMLSSIQKSINDLIGEVKAYASSLQRIIQFAKSFDGKDILDGLVAHNDLTLKHIGVLERFTSSPNLDSSLRNALEFEWWALERKALEDLQACEALIAQLPDPTTEEKSRDFLTLAQERFRKYVSARAEYEEAETSFIQATKLADAFVIARDEILAKLYDEVADDFTDYYRKLNEDDERDFSGKLIPSAAKLGFDVDFFGYGMFPPGAYHSEGHQDGMGVCLYLALMKRTLGEGFSFAVLDDIFMSVDASHRREVCKLLKREFPDTQFILTTHDPIWLKFMQTEGLIGHHVSFTSWSVETGPKIWKVADIFSEIEILLSNNDIPSAAAKLRYYLEFWATSMADALRAKVQFRGDGNYALGDLMQPVVNRWLEKLKDAVKVARSWERDDDAYKLIELRTKVNQAQQKAQIEQWAINKTVHYNPWANLQASEFRIVVDAYKELIGTMRCERCQSNVGLEPRIGSAETIRCNCGHVFYNLVSKENAKDRQ